MVKTGSWELRTPPISGTYNDYGGCDFEESYITRLIEEVFANDVVEMPFGFNQYHDVPVPKNPTIHELIRAAWEGRLYVKPEKSKFLTWQEVRDFMISNGLPIMQKEREAAYSAQQIDDGIVFVHFNQYEKTLPKINKVIKVIKVLKQKYDCKLVKDSSDQYGVIVVDPDIENPTYLYQRKIDETLALLNEHPSNRVILGGTNVSVITVMVLQEVWDTFKNASWEYCNENYSLESYKKKLIEAISRKENDDFGFLPFWASTTDLFTHLPFTILLAEHFEHLLGMNVSEAEKEDAITVFSESAAVEKVMSFMTKTWKVYRSGGQEAFWGLRKEIGSKIQDYVINKEKMHNDN